NRIVRQERLALVKLLKTFKLKINALAGFDKAMITKGGVSLAEIDPQTMRSKIIENLFICGEILDLDGPTGGFNLQICWTTGYAAGDMVK
ncbi:MAG: NAD(P)/FAD-dependent oxidoreductase, partial [Candidatus Parcubacteria bacterium]|nr:NAD(P)/FAD-dependent oxidoreductase [Candidatus Parcubacteria bacterium]